jgi:tetratricopeptide (TPR) repeat protein
VEAARQQTQAQVAQAEVRRQSLSSRLIEHRQRALTTDAVSGRLDSGTRSSVGVHVGLGVHRPSYLHARYYDRPDLIRYSDRHLYTYYDPYHRLHHRIVWPTYYYPVYYPFGTHAYYHHVWPYYHRKYVFISLGGWWPYDYTYRRYYWYGYHPYVWYGYYPVAREVAVGGGDSYYTYNYNYYSDDGGYTTYSSSTPVDQSTLAEVRTRLQQQQPVEPAPQTLADTRFDEGVKSFEGGDYAAAAVKFDEAMRLAPKDMILPYAYAQALFADGDFDRATDVLRVALQEVSPDQEGVFFPRGLYANDDVLYGQIEKLLDRIDRSGADSDLRLLLGYQLLGVGETGHAREQLELAKQDPKNAESVGILLNLTQKLEEQAPPAVKAGGETTVAGSTEPPVPTAPAAPVENTAGADAGRSSLGRVQDRLSGGTSEEPAGTLTPPAGITPVPGTESKPGTPGPGSLEVGPRQDLDEPADGQDNAAATGAMSQDDGRAVVEKAGFFRGSAGGGLWSGLSRLLGSDAPNYKADMAVFAALLSLALAGVWIEWRLLGRKPV